jgi:hypothetical protein
MQYVFLLESHNLKVSIERDFVCPMNVIFSI